MVIHALKNLYLKINIMHEKIYLFRTIILHYCESLLDCIEGVGNIGTKSVSPFISSPSATRSTVLIVCFLFVFCFFMFDIVEFQILMKLALKMLRQVAVEVSNPLLLSHKFHHFRECLVMKRLI